MLLSISPEDFKRLDPYLPKGLVDRSGNPLERAAGQLARMILTQRIHPGQKIPMDEIAANIGVSRTPVREALRLLETEGLVSSLPNRGFIVRRLDPAQTEQLYSARHCLEAFLAKAAADKRDKRFLSEIVALHRVYERVLGGPSDRRRLGMLVDKAFHVRIAEQAGNPYLTSLLANVFDRLIMTRPIEGFPVNRMALAVQEHAQIVGALKTGDARAVVNAVLKNVDSGGNAIVQHLQTLDEFDVAQR
jgi:DNA-binding GntR family transcriptional regulator